MIFFHKPYYNPNNTNPKKKKNYTKYTNYIMQKNKKTQEKNLETKF